MNEVEMNPVNFQKEDNSTTIAPLSERVNLIYRINN
jgi:hypothetical protein